MQRYAMNNTTEPGSKRNTHHGLPLPADSQQGAVDIKLIIVVVVIVLALGAGYWFFVKDKKAATDFSGNTLPPPPHYMTFKDMVVNLVNDETFDLHYMQLSVALMTRSSKCHITMEHNRPAILNTMLELLPTWTFQDAMNPDKRELLRTQLLEAIRTSPAMPVMKEVEGVFITNMVIQ